MQEVEPAADGGSAGDGDVDSDADGDDYNFAGDGSASVRQRHQHNRRVVAAAEAAEATATARADAATLGIADQRAASKEAWMALLKGTCSGTFVLRASAGMEADAVATITVVRPGGAGAGHFHHRIIRDGKRVKLIGSQHAHKSLAELVAFYQNAKYFAQAGKPDVPASDNSVTPPL